MKDINSGCLGEFQYHDDIDVLYIEFVDGKYIVGSACNAGIIPIVELEYDSDYTHDQHVEILIEMLSDEGYFLL